jgi:hypothetical protein
MQETSDGRFRARAGTLTLLSATVLVEREELLAMLVGARSGGMLLPIDPDEWAAQGEDEEFEDEELDLELDLDHDEFPPDAPMRTTPAGEVFLDISLRLMHWLKNCQGPLGLGSAQATEALLLTFCWSAKSYRPSPPRRSAWSNSAR